MPKNNPAPKEIPFPAVPMRDLAELPESQLYLLSLYCDRVPYFAIDVLKLHGSHADELGRSLLTNADVAKMTGKSLSTIKRANKILVGKGALVRYSWDREGCHYLTPPLANVSELETDVENDVHRFDIHQRRRLSYIARLRIRQAEEWYSDDPVTEIMESVSDVDKSEGEPHYRINNEGGLSDSAVVACRRGGLRLLNTYRDTGYTLIKDNQRKGVDVTRKPETDLIMDNNKLYPGPVKFTDSLAIFESALIRRIVKYPKLRPEDFSVEHMAIDFYNYWIERSWKDPKKRGARANIGPKSFPLRVGTWVENQLKRPKWMKRADKAGRPASDDTAIERDIHPWLSYDQLLRHAQMNGVMSENRPWMDVEYEKDPDQSRWRYVGRHKLKYTFGTVIPAST